LIDVSIKKQDKMSPRTEKVNERIRDEQREKILDAAKGVFARKGFAATKMADVAAGASVSYGLVYHYFTNKDAVFASLVEHAVQGSMGLHQRALERPGTPWDRMTWLVSQILDGLRDQSEYFMLVVQMLTSEAVPEELRERTLKQVAISKSLLRQLIIEGQAAGQMVPGDPDQLTTLCNSCIQGLAISAFLDRELFLTSFPEASDLLRILKREGDPV
jgi:AcrR family transcriptional regulator